MQPDRETWPSPQTSANTAQIATSEQRADQAPVVAVSSEQSLVEPTPNEKLINPDEDQVVRWQATEYIHRDKSSMWYIVFGVVVLALIALAIFVFRSITFAILIPVMAAALVIYAYRPPETLDYTLSRKGLHINDRLYPYEQFKEFGLLHGDDQYSVVLVPRERFKPGVTVYFPEDVGEAVVDMLAARLPMHEAHIDVIDRLIRKLKI